MCPPVGHSPHHSQLLTPSLLQPFILPAQPLQVDRSAVSSLREICNEAGLRLGYGFPFHSSKGVPPLPLQHLWTERTFIENALAVPGLKGSQLPVSPTLVYHHCP